MAVTAPPELRPRGTGRRALRRPRRRWALPRLPLGVALVGVVGILVLLYPSVASWFSQYQQSQLIDAYSTVVEANGPAWRQEALDVAHTYNEALTSGALLDAGSRIPTNDGELPASELDYDSLLVADSSGLMARLKIPSIDADLPIYHGTSDATLLKGVGHLEGTALPVGGSDTHSVLTAHRGLADATLFTHLDQVGVKDTFTIEVFGEVLTYRVIRTQVVEPHETETLYPETGADLVTLVTCTPLGINSHRILVTGERITPTPLADVASAGASPEVPGFPWWIVVIGATTAVAVSYVWRAGRQVIDDDQTG